MSELRDRVESRMRELEPAIAEYEELRRIAATFEKESASPSAKPSRRRTETRRPGSQATTARRRTRARKGATGRRNRGDRSAAVLDLVNKRPGISVGEVATEMGIGTTYLYRVLPRLEREGKVRKEGRGYHPAES